MLHEKIEFHLDPAQRARPLSNVVDGFSERYNTQRYT
jgi:hypothetical protein